MSYFGHWTLKVRYAGLTRLLFLIGELYLSGVRVDVDPRTDPN